MQQFETSGIPTDQTFETDINSTQEPIETNNDLKQGIDYFECYKIPSDTCFDEGDVWVSPDKKIVKLIMGDKVIRKYRFNEPIINAGLIQFDKEYHSLAIILQNTGRIYNLTTGNQSIISFPFPIGGAFWYSNGIILERAIDKRLSDLEYPHKYITLTDPIGPFGLVSFANNQLDILKSSRMVAFANSNYNNNFSVLYDNNTNMLNIYYTRLLNNTVQKINSIDKSPTTLPNSNEINNTTIINDNSKSIKNKTLRRMLSSKRRVTSTSTNGTSTISALSSSNRHNNFLALDSNDGDPLSQVQTPLANNDISMTMGRLYSTNLTQDNQMIGDTLELTTNNNNLMNTTLTSLHLDNNVMLPNPQQDDLINQSILSNDISLVKVSSISLPNDIRFLSEKRLRSLRCIPLRFHQQEALVFFDRENNFAKIWSIDMISDVINSTSFKLYGNTPENMIKLSNFQNNLLYNSLNEKPLMITDIISCDIILKQNEIQGTLALIYDDIDMVLYNPFLELYSHIIHIQPLHFDVLDKKDKTSKLYLEKSIFIYVQNTLLYPTNQFTKQCFTALKLIVPEHIFLCILFIWQFLLHNGIVSMENDSSYEFSALSYVIKLLLELCLNGPNDSIDESLQKNLTFKIILNELTNITNTIPKIIMGFHLIREEIYLNVLRKKDLSLLDEFLSYSVNRMNWPAQWKEYYQTNIKKQEGQLNPESDNFRTSIFAHPLDEPPSIMKSLYSITENSQIPLTKFISFSRLVDSNSDVDILITPRCFKTLRLYEIIHSSDFVNEYILDILSELKVSNLEIETSPIGIMKPLKELLHLVEDMITKPDQNLNFSLIARPDLERIVTSSKNKKELHSNLDNKTEDNIFNFNSYLNNNAKKETTSNVFEVLADIMRTSQGLENELSTRNSNSDEPYNSYPDQISSKNKDIEIRQNSDLIFGGDQRFKDALTLVNNSTPQRVHFISTKTEYTAVLAKRKIFLQIISLRLATAGLGYGAMLYGTETPLSTQKWHIPEICHTVVFSNGSRFNITSQETSDIISKWGDFHTGVASGLKITRNSSEITGSWIAFNRPGVLNATFGGFLLGLGLNGHLKNLEEWHIYNFLSPKITFVSVGLLLGLCASSRKSKDFKIIKVLSVHVVALQPRGSRDMNINVEVQIAGLIGIGLILQQSQNKKISSALMKEFKDLITIQGEEIAIEEYRIAVGISIGLINLGYGSKFNGYDSKTFQSNTLKNAKKWTEGDPDDIGVSSKYAIFSNDTLISKLLSILNDNTEQEKSWILENSQIGCIICLMFMFLKTNNEDIANTIRLSISESVAICRPDLYMYREWTYYMVLWNEIDYSLDFILNGIHDSTLKGDLDSDNLPIYYTIAGRILAIGIKYASTNNLKVRNNMLILIDTFLPFYQYSKEENSTFGSSADFKLAIKGIGVLINTLIVSASMVMCATGDIEVLRRVKYLHEVVTGKFSDLYRQMPTNDDNNRERMDDTVLSSAMSNDETNATLNVPTVTSDFQNDLDNEDAEILGEEGVEELIRKKIREEIDNECHYGKYLATNTALGYLFLGSGQYALKTSSLENVAYIVMSILPLYMEPYPFQELKHFWSLAVEPRCLVIKDAVTNEPINSVTVEVTYDTSEDSKLDPLYEKISITTPCLLPDITTLKTIEVHRDNYYPLELDFKNYINATHYFKEGTVIYIQPKPSQKRCYNNINDIRGALQEKMDVFHKGVENQSQSTSLEELNKEDEAMMELKLKLSLDKKMTQKLDDSDIYNHDMLCSDENSGDVADYMVELWKMNETKFTEK
ncbi:similar to Saccharomyces cerevisiae YNL172W APC1 Largest subunit of the Anaphase-Promoting Complex/Cyclosome (APC/C) [Maudiozyma barnettii]|uniref:Similar to Saccharomyces cerevisiae YNL172W APC1 Largest subunit of the Anaphase-Promoting Complex/Cyclosome (APC/C) n=1 Tax=Maudiozyma barnettii TaxID=61262 RepID=A0A8H2ZJ50_9SACH|nr:anaphase promoting complex subunit 1 [Kazachstania barnettii]CAB4253897.1 similar to Saccharomyces cerevisiae YNL172W APC1 Largest subunit of the Anaphase-Promoting Complex/Cyclosome (APC/C) [Kazachstania barnettii]CAD1781647.1 similar to Saccharomyces cerevisiae YNL172W APC1 Largest subunit of the Anaphase-Promoting Complex/Cyclosome (APC/C) [Kazachstania barnettii]